MDHPEILLITIFVVLYLYDSALLLYPNEAVLISLGRSGWIVGFGSNRTTLRGKGLYIPNPMFPNRSQFRLTWQYRASSVGASHTWEETEKTLTAFVPLVFSLFAASYVFLPLALFGKGGDLLVLITFFLVYMNVIFILSLLWFKRGEFNLNNGEFLSTAFDFLICPPFALNVIRRLSLRLDVKEDLVRAAARLQTQNEWERTRAELISRLDEEISGEDEGSEVFSAMQARRREIASRGKK